MRPFRFLVLLLLVAMGGWGCSSQGDAPITADTAAYVPLDDAAALAVPTGAPSASPAGASLAPARVGVVDLDQVVRRCHRTKEAWQRMLPVDLSHQTEVKKWEKAVAWFEAGGTVATAASNPEIDLGSGEGRARTTEEAREMGDGARARHEAWRRDLERDLRIAVYKDLAEALPAVAGALGVDVVVKHHAPDLSNTDPDMVDYEIANAYVLYYGKPVDLTEAAIRAVNEQYERTGGK